MEVFTRASFCSSQQQELKTDKKTQSTYWEVRSKNLQFTCFDVPPNRNFANHAHESEQMMYVLISIPSNKLHSVWTGLEGATAVDAWSPVNPRL